MTALSRPTKIFGINVGVDPKYVLGGLAVVALIIFIMNYRSGASDTPAPAATSVHGLPANPAARTVRAGGGTRRNRSSADDRGKLRIRPVDATRGDIDPTLRLEMLARLQSVPLGRPGRSLFELGAPMPTVAEIEKVNKKSVPRPIPRNEAPPVAMPMTPTVNVPFHFYGFVRPAAAGERNRGLFLDGDIVIVANEGETIDGRYLVVQLTPTSARIEDTQLKQGQSLVVVPEAVEQP